MVEMINKIYNEAINRLKITHVKKNKDVGSQLLFISEEYSGLWLEHVYDSILFARMQPEYLYLAENAVNIFIDKQKENGQLPFVVINQKGNGKTQDVITAKFTQIQECVSFCSLALEVYGMNNDRAFLAKAYDAGKKWDEWLRTYRMTTKRGLIEMFVGFDTGHDKSGRLEGISCIGKYRINGVEQGAEVLPPDDRITPILAVDMNCNFYGNEISLSKMAKILGKEQESQAWEISAAEIKKKIFEYCYDEKDAFFYDVDRYGNKRKYKSSTIFHLFLEKVLDKDKDKEIIDRIYREHIKNTEEFWTPYPFPSMALNDPSVSSHKEYNSWGYYTQGLIMLRCTRWMDYYGYGEDLNYICKKWVEAWTENFENTKLGQEIDPVIGTPTSASEWYSSTMISYIYAVRRLGLLNLNEPDMSLISESNYHWNFGIINPFVRMAYKFKWIRHTSRLTHAYDYRLYYITNGEGELLINNEKYVIEKETLFYIPKGMDYKFLLSKGTPVYAIYFDLISDYAVAFENTGERINSEATDSPFKKVLYSKTGNLFENIKRCIDEFTLLTPFYREITSGIVKSSMGMLLRESELNILEEDYVVRKVLLFCQQNAYNPSLSNRDVAAYVGYHPFYIGNLIKKSTGYSLREYLNVLRVEKAKGLLCRTNLSVASIAADCGFNSVTYFSKIFKERTGIVPGKYRKTYMLLRLPDGTM